MIELNRLANIYLLTHGETHMIVSTSELLDLELEIWKAIDRVIRERPAMDLRIQRMRSATREVMQ